MGGGGGVDSGGEPGHVLRLSIYFIRILCPKGVAGRSAGKNGIVAH